MNKKFVLGIYDDEDVLLNAIENIRAAGTKIHDVFSPYPVHGIDDVLGIKRSRLPIVAFFCGLFGTSFALWMQIWMLGSSAAAPDGAGSLVQWLLREVPAL